jgi:hypothetical protein
MNIKNRIIYTAFYTLISCIPIHAQNQTVGLFLNEPESFQGYTLFAPLPYTSTYLIDNEGNLVHSWDHPYRPGNSVYLLENGHLLRTGLVPDNQVFSGGGAGGIVQEIDWDGTIVWEYTYDNEMHKQHHDVEMLPDGNILMIAWEYKTKAEAILAGRNPALLIDNELWPDHIIEVEPAGQSGGDIVWEWHLWDHLIQDHDSTKGNYGIVADHPELVDINYVNGIGNADWNHMNAIDYNETLDQIIVSLREFDEIWIIDHSTTTQEASGHTGGKYGKGGDLLYRWGNPQVYRMGTGADRKLFGQHDVQWIPKDLPGGGNILLFNNGWGRTPIEFSSVDVISPPINQDGTYGRKPGEAFRPLKLSWTYQDLNPEDFFSSYISGAQRLPNGNTLICSGANGTFFEVTIDKKIVWQYINPVIDTGPVVQGDPVTKPGDVNLNSVFRAYRYAPDYAGLAGKDLTPGDPVEIYTNSVKEPFVHKVENWILNQNYPNPFNPSTEISFQLSRRSKVKLTIFNQTGQEITTLLHETKPAGIHRVIWNSTDNMNRDICSGIYIYKLQVNGHIETKKMVFIK